MIFRNKSNIIISYFLATYFLNIAVTFEPHSEYGLYKSEKNLALQSSNNIKEINKLTLKKCSKNDVTKRDLLYCTELKELDLSDCFIGKIKADLFTGIFLY